MSVLMFLATGALVALCFDLFRCLRKAYKHQPAWLVHSQDGVFLMIAGILLVVSLCLVDFGKIRWYSFVLLLAGSGVYFIGISPWFGKILTFFVSIPRFLIKIFFKKC